MQKLKIYIQYILPQHLLSYLAGKVASCQIAFVKNLFIKWFIKKYAVDLTQAQIQNINEYKNFNAFFTRRLLVNSRPIAQDKNTIISPVDGVISAFGNIQKNQILQAKGFEYTLENLLVNDAFVDKLINGEFITLYLSPKDYHRVHMPITGQLLKTIYVPGKLFSVNINTTNHIKNLYAKNERVIVFFQTSLGIMVLILVGAIIVSSINTNWLKKDVLRAAKKIKSWNHSNENIIFAKGAEIGYFELGSTVIVLLEKNNYQWRENINLAEKVFYGTSISQLH